MPFALGGPSALSASLYFAALWTPGVARRHPVASVLGAFIHTILVLGMLVATNGSGILTGNQEGVSIWAVVGGIFVANGIPEAIASGVLCTLVVVAWNGLAPGAGKSRLNSGK